MPIDFTEPLSLPDVVKIQPKRFGDGRGVFSETFKATEFEGHTLPTDWVQDNMSYTADKGVFRGLHFQAPPHSQGKLVTCISGAILDVAVDLRKDSATYGRYCTVELSEENGFQVFVPRGFAHGFLTLTPDVRVHYKADREYAPAAEGGLLWNDPDLGVQMPDVGVPVQTSEKDAGWQPWASFKTPFVDGLL